jgi:hypothetical protein
MTTPSLTEAVARAICAKYEGDPVNGDDVAKFWPGWVDEAQAALAAIEAAGFVILKIEEHKYPAPEEMDALFAAARPGAGE